MESTALDVRKFHLDRYLLVILSRAYKSPSAVLARSLATRLWVSVAKVDSVSPIMLVN